MFPRITSTLLLTLLAGTPVLAQTTWYVDDDACPSPGNGLQATPFCSIQDAIDAASDTDTVIVQPGTYEEAINFNGKAITVQGSAPNDPLVVIRTVLNGTVACISGEQADTVLRGLAITGEGVRNVSSSPTIADCTFAFSTDSSEIRFLVSNEDSSPTITRCAFGPGIASRDRGIDILEGAPNITQCTFTDLAAGIRSTSSDPTISDCTFTGTQLGINGFLGSGRVRDCSFVGKGGSGSSGLFLGAPVDWEVANCSISNFQDGLRCTGDGGQLSERLVVIDCSISGNVQWGMSNIRLDAIVTRCSFTANGEVGMYNFSASPVVSTSTFANNNPDLRASRGGVWNVDSSGIVSRPTFTDCIFTANGGAIGGPGGVPTVAGSIFCLNDLFDIDGAYDDAGDNLLNSVFCPPPTACAPNDQDCDGVADNADLCPGVDDSVDANNNGIPDCSETCVGDTNDDFVVDLSDLATVLTNFGLQNEVLPPIGDINGDNTVDLSDLALVIANFGLEC